MNNVMRGSALIFQYAEQHVTGHSNISKIKITEKILCVCGESQQGSIHRLLLNILSH